METTLISTFISAIVGALVALWMAQRRISVENITQDRREWRKRVRETALLVHDALIKREEVELNKLRTTFRLNLNPKDDKDNEIIDCISLPEEGKELDRAEEFAQRVALMLKHDWERAKLEAGSFIMRVKQVRKWPKIIIYNKKRKNYKKLY
ncbi:MAG: hypothetical protein JZU65_15825 [Chlorobium sp.]|nr:hypothetical protein [Chlorobium sp.]